MSNVVLGKMETKRHTYQKNRVVISRAHTEKRELRHFDTYNAS